MMLGRDHTGATTPVTASRFSPTPTSTGRPGLLVIGDDQIAALCLSGSLSNSHHVQTVTTVAAALPRLRALEQTIIVTNLSLPDGDGVQLCTAAKTSGRTVLVLVCTSELARVPRALKAGCDSVLIKPFAPNLLYARLGRLTRDLQTRAAFPGATLCVGTNQEWPALGCPACHHSGAISFDATSLRRAWYACLSCEHVWIAKREK
jgi:DNA-binding response OmpR family regulator